MSDRLNELRRQRALVQEQLAWLDREISRETNESVTVPAVPVPPAAPIPPSFAAVPTPAPAASPSTLAPQRSMTQQELDAEAARILAQFHPKGASAQHQAARGVIIVFLASMTMLILAVSAWMLIKYLGQS